MAEERYYDPVRKMSDDTSGMVAGWVVVWLVMILPFSYLVFGVEGAVISGVVLAAVLVPWARSQPTVPASAPTPEHPANDTY